MALWRRGRVDLWEVPLAWLLLASVGYLAWPMFFWPRCRRWLIRSCLPVRSFYVPALETTRGTVLAVVCLVGISLVAVAPVVVMASVGLIGEHEYSWRNVSFSYPSEFREGEAVQTNRPESQLAFVAFSYQGDRDSGVYFQVLSWDVPDGVVENGDIPDSVMQQIIEEIDQQGGWGSVAHVHVGGLPAVATTAPKPAVSFSGADVWLAVTWVFDIRANRVYVVNCQYEDQHRAQVKEACEKVLSTFEVKQ